MPDPRFLVVRLGSLGDIVHTFPAVAALRELFPTSQTIWLTHPRWKFLVETSRLATEVWTVESRSIASLGEVIHQIRQTSWDAAIDYQGLWKSATIPFFGRVPRRIGFSSRTVREFGVPVLYTDRVDAGAAHVAEQNGELSQRAGAKLAIAPFSLQIPGVDQSAACAFLRDQKIKRYVVLSPGGGWRSKCWPAERFGTLARRLRESLTLHCVVNIGPGDDDLVQPLLATAAGDGAPPIFNGTLGQLMALLKGAACIIAGDTGPLHLAVALGTPSVALFGPTNPDRNGPFRGPAAASSTARDIVLRAPGVVTTHKRRDVSDPSMLALTVDQVFDSVQECLGASA
jgi:lipopolysaccharide heptosyltransferase I